MSNRAMRRRRHKYGVGYQSKWWAKWGRCKRNMEASGAAFGYSWWHEHVIHKGLRP